MPERIWGAEVGETAELIQSSRGWSRDARRPEKAGQGRAAWKMMVEKRRRDWEVEQQGSRWV